MANKGIMLTTLLVLALSLCLFRGQGHGDLATPPPCDCGSSNNNNNNNNNNVVHDVTQYGALGDGKPVYKKGENSNGIAFIKAWQEACHSSTGPSKVVIPPGKYVVAQIIFAGPCKSNNIPVELQGDLIADADVTQFPNHEFVVFENVDGVTFTGQGSIDISNQASKACTTTPTTNTNNKDAGNKGVDDFFKQMASIKLCGSKNIVIEGITSINPASNHVLVLESQNIIVRNIKFNANSNSNLNGSFNGNANGVVALKSNTSNGVYISASTQVSVSNSFINTANDCVTVAPGSSSISLTGLTCASGNGISIGGLAFTKAHLDVKGVLVKNCVFKGSAFGVKINPRLEAKLSLISDINLEGLIMDAVKCPIFINQQQISLRVKASIQAKIQNVIISNLRGTATTRSPLSFACSPFSPCKGIKVDNIDLSFIGNVLHGKEDQSIIGKTIHGKALGFLVNCLNAHVVFGGKHEGLNCNLLQ